MATNQTENYSLNQWELSDSVVMADFNADNQKVDAALAALDKRIDAAVADATQKVNAAADTAAKNLNAAIAAVTATMPRVQTGSYVGTGTYGEAHPNTLNFDFKPKILIFVDATREEASKGALAYTVFAMYPSTLTPWMGDNNSATGVGVGRMRVIWDDHSISWYADFLNADNSAGYQASTGPAFQNNAAGTTYHYIAIG